MPVPSTSHCPVVVIGAGLTGMSAALELQTLGVSHRVYERAPFAGGLATTRVEGDWRFDHTGHLLHLRDDTWRSRVLSWLDEEPLLIERQSLIFTHGCYTRYPFQANTHGLPPTIAYECLLGFMQAQVAEHTAVPRNFEEYCLHHFGAGISKHFMLPYNERLWGVPARDITTDWCDRFVPMPKLEDVAAGAVGLERAPLGYNAKFYYPRLGIGELSKALARQIKHLTLNEAPRGIDIPRRRVEFESRSYTYDVLINTAPLPVLLDLVGDLPPAVRIARDSLRCSHLWYLDVGLKRPSGVEAHWIYVPEAKYPFYRVGSYSRFSSALAPTGQGSLYVELASRDEPEMSQLMPEVERGLLEMKVIAEPGEIEFARLRKLDFAYVIYDHCYATSLAVIRTFLREARIISTGRYGGWNYSAMEDALRFGEEAARSAWELLK
jgi:protoporphyrinogen oxidase